MSPLHRFEQQLVAAWEPSSWQDVTVLVAVSGGADSVALLRALAAVKQTGEGRLIVAHLNHQLRGAASDADEAFVVELCRDLHTAREVGRVFLSSDDSRPDSGLSDDSPGGPSSDPGITESAELRSHRSSRRFGSLEAAARAARYRFLTETAGRVGARYVATAHTADDQAETILHRIVRGTGIAGLAGMARTRPLGAAATLIRPLLRCRRTEVLEYLAALGQPYCIDSSNADLQFTRNRIRHTLLPQLATEFNAEAVPALLRLGTLAGEAQAVLGPLAEQLAATCVVRDPSGAVRIAIAPLASQPVYVVRELLMAVWRQQGWPLQAMGFVQWEQLAALAQGRAEAGGDRSPQPGKAKRMFPGGVLVELAGGQLRLARKTRPD